MSGWARSCALVFALAPLACGVFASAARESFATDHHCNKDTITVVERPDLQSMGPWGTIHAYEVRGCNAHELVRCDQHRYAPDCSGVAFCETPGCASDYEGVSKRAFSVATTCPLDRVETVLGVADVTALAPSSIASDPERMTLWRAQYLKKLAGLQSGGGIIVLAKGCGATSVYECTKSDDISAPSCWPVHAP
jgi:hypothetical protein